MLCCGSYLIITCIFMFVYVLLSCLFIAALWSPAGNEFASLCVCVCVCVCVGVCVCVSPLPMCVSRVSFVPLKLFKVRKKATIRNQMPHLTQDTEWENDKTQENITHKKAKRSADHNAARNCRHSMAKTITNHEKRSTKETTSWNGKYEYWRA